MPPKRELDALASVYRLLEANGFRPGKTGREEAERRCDWLNERVREGRIRLDGTLWRAPIYARPGAPIHGVRRLS